MDRPVVVIGGGIGGLTTALALVHHDIPCAVYERAPELHEIGAGVALWPAPLGVFDRLGIGREVRALSAPWHIAGIRRADGRWLVRYTPEEFSSRLGEPSIGVHRGELQSVLLDALPEGVVHTGHECVGVSHEPGDPVVARFADGSAVEAKAVIAADGIRSQVRAQLLGDRPLRDRGYVGWRGTVDAPAGSDWHVTAGETWGHGGLRFGMAPMAGRRVSWFGTTRRFVDGGSKAELLELFGGWHDPIRDLITATPDDAIWRDRVYDRLPLRRWSVGPITLLGDAAHPMTPELGQGACQAVLDAWAVAGALAAHASPEAAFVAYEHERRRRASMVSLVARAAAVGGNAGSVPARLRDFGAKVVPPSVLLRQLAVITRA